jgi:hypothetical protein
VRAAVNITAVQNDTSLKMEEAASSFDMSVKLPSHSPFFQKTLLGISQPVCATPNFTYQYILYAHFLLTNVARDTDADQVTISQSISCVIPAATPLSKLQASHRSTRLILKIRYKMQLSAYKHT